MSGADTLVRALLQPEWQRQKDGARLASSAALTLFITRLTLARDN